MIFFFSLESEFPEGRAMLVLSFDTPLPSSYILASMCLCPGARIRGSCLNAKKLDWEGISFDGPA